MGHGTAASAHREPLNLSSTSPAPEGLCTGANAGWKVWPARPFRAVFRITNVRYHKPMEKGRNNVITIDYFAWNLAITGGDRPCVRDDHNELSYREFGARVDAFGAQLSELGVGAGDVVALALTNRAELLIAMMASWRIGAAATPLNPNVTAAEADYQITDSGAALTVTEESAGDEIGERAVICIADMAVDTPGQWVAPGEPASDDLALLVYTSGSTGKPKGVELTHANLQYMASAMVQHLSLTIDDHSLLILPLFHVNAICVSVLAPMLVGGQVSITGRFSPSRFFDDVESLRPTYFSAVPTIYALLSSQPTEVVRDTSSVRFAVCGAAPISTELLDLAASRFGFAIVEGYGLTEGTCASACNPPDGLRKSGTVGPALPGQRIAIADESGRRLPVGDVGEVLVSGPNVMRGYLHRRDETARTVVDGWLRTGDVGRLDVDGYLTLVGRIKDMIIRGGENLYPKEIEDALAAHSSVLEAAVVGAPDRVYGEVPVAYVVSHPGMSTGPEELIEHLGVRLTKAKLPVAIHIVESLPRNPVGKIDKPGLRRSVRERSAELVG